MPETKSPPAERNVLSVVAEYVVIFVVAYLLAMILQNFLIGSFQVQQYSMQPTLYENDRIFINRLTYKFGNPRRDDIVILVDPMGSQDDYVKRVIGLPGEIFAMKEGDVYINYKKLTEPYIAKDKAFDTIGPMRIPEDSYFVMGDNRAVSHDSRRFGPIQKKGILGKVILVLWPPSHARVPY